ncbi:DUF916 domain-containing protein [Microbacterium rhizomatis]|uniref:DUF916 domain-containing protein n=1 Tax=Microbacterium rhizomatis TaxID=1631477 RepID=A0A5J5J0G1_9MICO|nr:DUF916 domain-containing protein [Microbacterium rhizomatis]KAA9108001.1 DUF916 domain-containing protein [Microbacterium rhizomatis]
MNGIRIRTGAIAFIGMVLLGQMLGGVGPSAAIAAEGDVSWSVAPASDTSVDGRVSIRQTLEPGTTVVDHVAVTNHGDIPAAFLVYASDGIISETGDFDLLPAGQAPRDSGTWMTISEPGDQASPSAVRTVEIPAKTMKVLAVRIQVPADATPGDHPAGVVAELTAPDGSGLEVSTRVGVRVHLRVSGEIQPQIDVEVTRADYAPSWNPFEPGTIRVEAVVRNAGNVRLGAETLAVASGPFGLLAAESASASVRELLPGQQTTVSAALSAWPLVYISGALNVLPVVVGEDSVPTTLTSSSTPFVLWVVPWIELGALLVVVGLIVAGVLLTRARRARFDAAVDARARALADAGPPSSGPAAGS